MNIKRQSNLLNKKHTNKFMIKNENEREKRENQ